MDALALQAGTKAAYESPPAGRLTFLYTNAAYETGITLAAELNEQDGVRMSCPLAVLQPCSCRAPSLV